MNPSRRLALLALPWLIAVGTAAADQSSDPWFEAGRTAVVRARGQAPAGARLRAGNVILFVGDGMGIATVTAARILEGQRRNQPGEENRLAFELLPHLALSRTYNTNQQVPDSAGTMSAMVTGVKTKAGVLSLNDRVARGDHTGAASARVGTLLEEAERRGLSTGVVTTTRVTHATPAACYAHAPERDWESDSDLPEQARRAGFPDIARQLLELSGGDGLEVVLGGGRAKFLPSSSADPEDPESRGSRADGRDLTAEWRARFQRAAYVWNQEQFEAVDLASTDHLLGLFQPSHMNFEFDRPRDRAGEPSLSAMTAAAIGILARNPRGFFLMVEGGRIDHGHHAGNAYRALTDTIEFSNAVRTALELIEPEETLVVVTADHSHVFSIAGYPTRGNDILGLVVGNDEHGRPQSQPLRDALGLPYTTLGYLNGPGYTGASDRQREGSEHLPHRPSASRGIREGRPDLSARNTAAPGYLQEAAIPLSSETHAGEDVPIYAGGPGAHLFHGVREQNYVYHAIAEALGWTGEGGADPHRPAGHPSDGNR
jgi:alkaline phosphatase